MSMPGPSLPPQIPTRSLAPVVLALLLGVAVIAIVIVKMTSSSEPAPEPAVASAPAPPPATASPAAAPPASAEPPPPPPSSEPPPPPASEAARPREAAPDTASARAAAPGAPKSSATRAARDPGCEAPCRGSATDQLVRALGSKASQARACYERALANDSGLAGKLEIAVRVSPDGRVCSATASSDTLKHPEVLGCVLGRFKAGILPKPTGGCVDASVPINFKPAGAG